MLRLLGLLGGIADDSCAGGRSTWSRCWGVIRGRWDSLRGSWRSVGNCLSTQQKSAKICRSRLPQGANSWRRGVSGVKALLMVADTTKLLTARQMHGDGWVSAAHDAMILGTMHEQ